MTALRNIISVAHYERIMLTRTTRFRFLGLVGLAFPMFFGVVLAIAETFGDVSESASVFGLSAFIPFYFYTYTQTALTAFVAGNFRADDDHHDCVVTAQAVKPVKAQLEQPVDVDPRRAGDGVGVWIRGRDRTALGDQRAGAQMPPVIECSDSLECERSSEGEEGDKENDGFGANSLEHP